MGVPLTEIAQQLKDSTKKAQLIYAFNGTGKTRLSREFKDLITPRVVNEEDEEPAELSRTKILYYNAFTEDLFYWDNDLDLDAEPKLKIQPNTFTAWVLQEQGQDQNIIANFQHYTDAKLTPHFNADFSEVKFSYMRGNQEPTENIKISKGEESNFIWSLFYSLLEQVISVLNVTESSDRETNQFDKLEYVFIDDPVSSLDENHLIELAVDLSKLIKSSKSELKFIITTHNPLFYNVLHNELTKAVFKKYILKKLDNGEHELVPQLNDSPFSYHLYLLSVLEKAISTGQIHKYHFNFLRNVLEKTSTFLGYEKWGDLLPTNKDGLTNPYEARLINISSHSKYSGEEVTVIKGSDKLVLGYLVRQIREMYRFKSIPSEAS